MRLPLNGAPSAMRNSTGFNQFANELGVVQHFIVATKLGVFVLQNIEAMRTPVMIRLIPYPFRVAMF
jgi:hypothetical protein